MASFKQFLFVVLLILLPGVVPQLAVLAQQTAAAENAGSPKPSGSQTVTPSPEIKDVPDRLPFMVQSEPENHEQAPSAGGLMLRTLGALLLIVGLIVAAAWGMKRFGGARFGSPKADAPELAVLSSIALGERRSLAVVRFGQRTLLLGSTPQAVTLLAEDDIEDLPPRPQSVAEILSETFTPPFADELSTATRKLQGQVRKGDEDLQW